MAIAPDRADRLADALEESSRALREARRELIATIRDDVRGGDAEVDAALAAYERARDHHREARQAVVGGLVRGETALGGATPAAPPPFLFTAEMFRRLPHAEGCRSPTSCACGVSALQGLTERMGRKTFTLTATRTP